MSQEMTLSRIAFVHQDTSIQDAVKEMIKRSISSILICNSSDEVVGILTERDVVHKCTLLEVQDKLAHCVSTVMSRPVKYARLQSLEDDVLQLHLEHKIRHFPVVDGTDTASKRNVIGIISVTDIARVHLRNRHDERLAPKNQEAPEKAATSPYEIALMVQDESSAERYRHLFAAVGYKMVRIHDMHPQPQTPGNRPAKPMPLIFDLDGWPSAKLSELLPAAQMHYRPLLLTASDPRLVTALKQLITDPMQHILIKPLDMSYCDWLLREKMHS